MVENRVEGAEADRIRQIATTLREIERPIRILRSISWPSEVRRRFMAADASRLPEVEYPGFDSDPTLRALERVRGELHVGNTIDDFLLRQARALELSARMLSAVGTSAFFEYSRALYGSPGDPIQDAATTSLDLAELLEEVLGSLAGFDLGVPAGFERSADDVAAAIDRAVVKHFGELSPLVEVVDDLSANALAGPRRIRVRRGGQFIDLDVRQLIQHEAYVHVGTSLNGGAQQDLPILAASHAGTMRTQEGLAVFAEFISGAIDVDRMRRLASRVRGIEMAAQGADFIEVYRHFLSQDVAPEQAFENARRIFRGGVITGGAPFTKDVVYLDGLLRVHNFLRVIASEKRFDCLRLLFCGKLDIEDIPALAQLTKMGLCALPRFLPPWAQDVRFLVAYLAYSAFLGRVHFVRIREHYEAMLHDTPVVEL